MCWDGRQNQPGTLTVGENATLSVGCFRTYGGAYVSVAPNATLALGSGFINNNSKISCFKEITVGENVKIWGRIQSRQYEKKFEDGTSEMRRAYEVSISKMEIEKDNGISEYKLEEQQA